MIGCVVALAAGIGVSAQTSDVADKPISPAEAVRVFYTGTGQFEIITLDSSSIRKVLTEATDIWDALEVLLGLPAEGFPSAITVRLVSESQWSGPAVFLAVMEPGATAAAWARRQPGPSPWFGPCCIWWAWC